MKRTHICSMFLAIALIVAVIGCEESGNELPPTDEPTPVEITPSPQAMDQSIGLAGKWAASSVQFDPEFRVAYLEANIQLDVEGSDPAIDFINAGGQTFKGLVAGKRISGTITNQPVEYTGRSAPSFPLTAPEELAAYLGPEPNLESDDPIIVATAEEIVSGASDAWTAAVDIAQWVDENIALSMNSFSASRAIVEKDGDMGTRAHLTIAMCRAAGIPSRIVGGLAHTGGSFAQHFWIECHMGPDGWIPMDPATGEYGSVDAAHLRLFENNAIQEIASLEIVDYAEAKQAVPRTLELAVGLTRNYSYIEDGVEFGTGSYEVTGRTDENGTVYTIDSLLHLEPITACEPTDVQSTLTIAKDGQPVRYDIPELKIGTG